MIEYALYRGDTFITIGTRKQLVNRFHIRDQNFDDWTTPEHCDAVMANCKGFILVKLEPIYDDILVNDELI